MSDERGFTLIEVLVAATIVAVGLLGTLRALESSQTLSTSSEARQQALAYAQARVEELASVDWPKLGLDQAPQPVPAATPDDPARFVAATGLLVPADPRRGDVLADGVAATGEPFVVVPGGFATTAEDDKLRATVHQYVTTVDPCMKVGATTSCPAAGAPDAMRRITVVVDLHDGGRGKAPAPVWVSTLVSNPTAKPLPL
jgi:prepilin-type N-terminal cleavage/methylation domain-containing protein